MNCGNVLDMDDRAIDHFDRKVIEILDSWRAVVDCDIVITRVPTRTSPAGRIHSGR